MSEMFFETQCSDVAARGSHHYRATAYSLTLMQNAPNCYPSIPQKSF